MTDKAILIVASGGGHWIQMTKILPAIDGLKCVVATVDASVAQQGEWDKFYLVKDFNKKNWWLFFSEIKTIIKIIKQENITHIISTGAAPGFVGVLVGRFLGKKTIWVDSIANPERLSLSGYMASYFVDRIYTQWEQLSGVRGAIYSGRVL